MPIISLILIILSILIYLTRCILNKKQMIDRNTSMILLIIALLFDLLSGLLVL